MTLQNGSPTRPGWTGIVVGGSVGAIVGFVIGFAVAGGLWLWAFSRSLDGAAFDVPGLVSAGTDGGMATAQGGPLLLATPFLAAAIVAGLAVLIMAVRRSRRLRPLAS